MQETLSIQKVMPSRPPITTAETGSRATVTDRLSGDCRSRASPTVGAIKKIGVEEDDVIFCGRQAIDGDTAQVGPQIAEKLHVPQVSYVAEITVEGKSVTVKRLLEDGDMTIKVATPCLLTCVKELNPARYMSVGGIMECYQKPLEVYNYETLKDDPLIDVDTIGLKGSPTNVYKSFSPPVKGAGMMLEGADKAAVDKLVGLLDEKHII